MRSGPAGFTRGPGPGATARFPGGGRVRSLYGMPRYEYRCRTCEDTFEVNRPMAESSAPADCPDGHSDTVKLLSAVAVGGTSSAPAAPMGGGGGCCGGGGCG